MNEEDCVSIRTNENVFRFRARTCEETPIVISNSTEMITILGNVAILLRIFLDETIGGQKYRTN